MRTTWMLALGTALSVLLASQAAETAAPPAPAPRVTLGAFRPSPALALYINVTDAATGRLTVRRGARREGDRLMLRVFDPAEQLTFWQYLEPGQLKDTLGPGSGEIYGIPITIPDTIFAPNDLLADMDVALLGTGVHQVRVTAGQNNSVVTVQLDRACDYGVSFQNGTAYPWDPALKAAYVYVPPHAEQLTVRATGVQIEDEAGKTLFPAPNATDPRPDATLPVTRTGVVWTFRFPDPAKWSLAAAGFPLILCTTAAAAETIKASVEVLPDGTTVCHKFQRRIAELLPTLLTPDKVGKTDELLALWQPSASDPGWLEQPLRLGGLLGGYGLFPQAYAALAEQNLDPASHWSGAIGTKTWKEKAALPAPENRWDRLRSVPGLWAGASPSGNAAQALAEAADLDLPLNPWRGRSELRWRAAASALRDLMTLGEDEVWRGIGADLDSYPGMLGFVVAKKHFPEFALVAPHLPPEVRSLWAEGLRHVVDRHLPDLLVSAMNQSSHYLVGWENFAQGSGDPRYTDLARRYAQRFARSASPAGYFIENCGPDATYCGMQHFHMALYCRLSGDTAFLEAVRSSYRFFNHTVAPEPDGRVVGASNFAHRTPDGFHNEQYGGAKGLLDDLLPEVGLWAREPTAAERDQAVATLREQLGKPLSDSKGLDFGTPRYRYGTDTPDRSAAWPAAEKRPFIRNLAGELIAVKRPAYYTAIYVGRPAPADFYIRGRSVFRQPLPDRAEDSGADPWSLYYTIHAVTPLLGGGMSLFWTPGYGSALFAGNCTPLAHHGLVAIDKQGVRWWEDYMASRFELDEKAGVLTVTGKLEGQPWRYTRTYRFLDDRVEVELRLETDQDQAELADLIENLPLLGGPAKARGQTLTADNDQPVTDDVGVPAGKTVLKSTARSRTLRVTDNQGRGVEIRLDAERPLRLCRSGMTARDLVRFDRAEIVLPTTVTRAAPVVLRYALVPLP
jgi:hypothetical protein